MKIGRVAGTVVATICSPVFEGRRLLMVDLLDEKGRATGRDLIAVDSVGAQATDIDSKIDDLLNGSGTGDSETQSLVKCEFASLKNSQWDPSKN